MRLVTTFVKPTEGTVYWNGTDVFDDPNVIRSAIGYLPQTSGGYPSLTAREFLSYLAGIRGVRNAGDRIDDLLALVNLGDAADDRLGGFSGGMRQRVGIAQALLSDPEFLVVNEPTVGLDPEGLVRFRNVLADLGEDRVVVLSTRIVSDIEATASDVALLHEGQLVAHEHPSALIERASGTVWEWVVPDSDIRTVKQTHTISTTTRQQDGVRVRAIAETAPDATAENHRPSGWKLSRRMRPI